MSNEPLAPRQKSAKSVRTAQRLVDQRLAGNQQCQAECYTPARTLRSGARRDFRKYHYGVPGPRPCTLRARHVSISGAALCGNHWKKRS